ncbi:MAG: hypothetical protein WKF78_15300 [Candidatus Limnocylindrales bacterium]
MRPRDEPDLDRDRSDVGQAAAVDPDALVEDQPSNGLLLDQVEQALADAGLTSRRLEQLRRVAALALGADRAGDRLAQGRDPARQVVREPEQQVGRGLGVRQGAMALGQLDPEETGEVTELVRLRARIARPGR